jgi:hypothetical protein
MNDYFFKRRTRYVDEYKVKVKFCDYSKKSDICVARYITGEYFIQVVLEEEKILNSITLVIYKILASKNKGLLIPKYLIRRIKNEYANSRK